MLRNINKTFASSTEKGSLMIEALAMLGLISMVTPVIYKKAAERTTEMQDVNAASQVRVIVKSVDDYLRDNYNTITNGGSVGSTSYAGLSDNNPVALPINDDELRKYLPIGFNPNGKTFNGFNLAINQKTTGSKKTLTAVLVANTTNTATFNKLRASRIASMVGTNGGYVDGNRAMGVQGVWEIPTNQLPNASAPNNTIVATSLQAIADGTAGGDNVLHRIAIAGRPELNTMETALNMGSQNITQVNTLIAQTSGADANTITMEASGDGNLTLDVDGSTNIAKSLQAAIAGGGAQFKVSGTDGSMSVSGGKMTVDGTGHTIIQNGTDVWGDLSVGLTSNTDTPKFQVMGTDGSMYAANKKMSVDSVGNTEIQGTTTGWGNFQIGTGGANNFNVTASDGSMSAATGHMTVDGLGNTLIKGTTTGWGNLQIGENGTENFSVAAANGNTFIKGTTTGWGDLQIGSNGADNFLVNATDGSMSAATGNMTVDADGNTTIQGWTQGYDDLTIFNEDGDEVLYVDSRAYDYQSPSDVSDGKTYIRRGVIMLPRNSGTSRANATGYIKADRLVANYRNGVDKDNMSPILDQQTGSGGYFQNYEVNPAYTSMMHDIKLSTRGGARLSDILPDFINKGIYVMDNTYTGSANWEEVDVEDISDTEKRLAGLTPCDNVKCDTSAWLGFIPSPNCPYNYRHVATITPIRFNMAQAGIPMKDKLQHGNNSALELWNIGQHHDPLLEGANNSQITETAPYVDIRAGSGSSTGDNTFDAPYYAELHNLPYNFQINTWLNTTLKAYYKNGFKGWHGIMGFIYPGIDYERYAKERGISPIKDDTIIWNLFPVYKEELSAIATVYCYFDRQKFDSRLVDHYEAHRESIDNIRSEHQKDKGDKIDQYLERLNDPRISEHQNVW